MESSSLGEHQVQSQAQNPANHAGRYRNRNWRRPGVPPANAVSSDGLVAPETDNTDTRPPRRNINQSRPRDREQGSSKPRRPPRASQIAGSSSHVDGTNGEDVRSHPPRRPQGASAANELPVSDSAPAQPESKSQRPSRRAKFNASLSKPIP